MIRSMCLALSLALAACATAEVSMRAAPAGHQADEEAELLAVMGA
jgi:hypothetical protein